MAEPVLACGKCIAKNNPLDRSLIGCPYISPLDRWLPQLKDQRNFSSAPALQQLLVEALCSSEPLNLDLILPMPIHWTRRCRRGYNQTEILAKPLAKILGLPMRCDILKRSRRVRSQRGLKASERLQNQRGSFSISAHSEKYLIDKQVLLVEDIVTTGATATEAARTLKVAGVRSVILAAVARTLETHT